MEGSRSNSRVVIHDRVYDKIQQIRYSKHLQSLDTIVPPMRKSNSDYLSRSINIASKLHHYRQARANINEMLDPKDLEFRNCQRRMKDIQNSYLKLPKISTIKLQESRVAKEEQKNRVDKENSILKSKMKHLDVQKKQKFKELAKSIQQYQKIKKISRRVKEIKTQEKEQLNPIQNTTE